MNSLNSATLNERRKEKKKTKDKIAKIWVIIWTLLYSILFVPLLLLFIMGSVYMLADAKQMFGPEESLSRSLCLIILYAWTPLSIPITIYLIWSRYIQSQYMKMFLYTALPIYNVVPIFTIAYLVIFLMIAGLFKWIISIL